MAEWEAAGAEIVDNHSSHPYYGVCACCKLQVRDGKAHLWLDPQLGMCVRAEMGPKVSPVYLTQIQMHRKGGMGERAICACTVGLCEHRGL